MESVPEKINIIMVCNSLNLHIAKQTNKNTVFKTYVINLTNTVNDHKELCARGYELM